MVGGLTVWWFGGLLVWWFGGLVVWWFDGLVVWWFDGLVVCWFGGLVVWWFAGLVVLRGLPTSWLSKCLSIGSWNCPGTRWLRLPLQGARALNGFVHHISA